MAAIATITIPANENPLATGWDKITGLTDCKSTAGAVMQATSGTVDCGVVEETGFTATDTASANGSKGVQAKWTIGSGAGLESGSAVRFVWGYTDQDNYLYARLVIDGTTVFTNLKRDNLRLYKRVAAVETELTADSALKYLQLDIGDLRFDPVVAGTTFRIVHVHSEVILMMDDRVFRQETSTGITNPSGKVGVIFEGLAGGHTNEISKVQAQLITAQWTTTTGNDSTGNGSRQAPYLTFKKLISVAALNEVCFVGDGDYTDDYSPSASSLWFHISSSNATGNNFEDGPLLAGVSAGTPWFISTVDNNDYMFVSGESGLTYWQFTNINVKGSDTTTYTKISHAWMIGRDAGPIYLSNSQIKYTRGVTLLCYEAFGGANYEGGNWIWDMDFERCAQGLSGGLPSHHTYFSTKNNRFRYCHLNGTGCDGYGAHVYQSATGASAGDGNILEYNHVHNFSGVATTNASAGMLLSRGNAIGRYNLIHDCYQGITMGYLAVDAKAYWNIVYNCVDSGIDIGEFNCTTGLVENNTVYGCGDYGIKPVTGNTSVTLKNNIVYNNTPGEIGPDVGTVTKTTNMTTDPGFAGAGAGNFHLATDTNPPHEAGTANTAGVPSVDFDGWNVTGIVPIGAYDFIPPLLDIANALNSSTTINEDVENTIDLEVTGDGLSLLDEVWIRASQGTFTDVDVTAGATSDT